MSTDYTYHVTVSRPRPPRDPVERFWWAADREGWAENDIPGLLVRVQRRFAVYVVLGTGGAVDLIAGHGLWRLAALPLTVAACAKAMEAARQARQLSERRTIAWSRFLWDGSHSLMLLFPEAVAEVRGLSWGHRLGNARNAAYRARQWPRRGWCWLRGGIPPAPPGTLRITHETRTTDEVSAMLKGGRSDV